MGGPRRQISSIHPILQLPLPRLAAEGMSENLTGDRVWLKPQELRFRSTASTAVETNDG